MRERGDEDDEDRNHDIESEPALKFHKFRLDQTYELRSTLLLIGYDFIVVAAIICSLAGISFLLKTGTELFHFSAYFTYLFHRLHEAISLVVYFLLGLRTIDHFLGGVLSKAARKVLDKYWEQLT